MNGLEDNLEGDIDVAKTFHLDSYVWLVENQKSSRELVSNKLRIYNCSIRGNLKEGYDPLRVFHRRRERRTS